MVRAARPSHFDLRQRAEETLASLPASRWAWLFTPDPRWLNVVNTTALRTVNAIRMFVAITLLHIFSNIGTTAYALTRCGILIKIGTMTVFQLTPPPGKLSVADWRACEESSTTRTILDFTHDESTTYAWLLAAMAGIALGAMGIKRATDTEHKVRVEEAKKAPVIVAPVTGEQPAQETNINFGSAAPKPAEEDSP